MDSNKLIFERLIKAPREKVWQAWTEPEHVKKWWGPEGFTTPVAEIDLREGGTYLFCMRGKPAPDAEVGDFWSAGQYTQIVPGEKIVATDHFSDENGNKVSPESMGMPEGFPDEMEVVATFQDEGEGITRVKVIYPISDSPVAREAMLRSGMEAGWESTLEKLAKYAEKETS